MTLPFYADFDLNTFQLKNVNSKPILELGKPGTFDEHGIMPSCIVKNGDEYIFIIVDGSKVLEFHIIIILD